MSQFFQCLWLKSWKNSWKQVQFLLKFHLLHRYFPEHFFKNRKNKARTKIIILVQQKWDARIKEYIREKIFAKNFPHMYFTIIEPKV